MAEFTRHRLASFSIESTRFNAYDELTFIRPKNLFDVEKSEGNIGYMLWLEQMKIAEESYLFMRDNKISPEQARAILPNSLKTEIVMTANLREWRHILKLRTAKATHPQMRQVANMILEILKEKLPIVFEDIGNIGDLTVKELAEIVAEA